ncbi:hypothetical protein FRC00_007625, partial [Tulasnella sp. 408]
MNLEGGAKRLLSDARALDVLKAFSAAMFVAALYKLAGYILRELLLVPKLTILRDVEDLRKARKGPKIPGRAVICGGRLAAMRIKLRYGGVYYEDLLEDVGDKKSLTLGITREAAETLIRRSLRLSRPNVAFKTGTVTGFIRDGDRLGGVAVRTEAGEVEERADFVVGAQIPVVPCSRLELSANLNTPDASGPTQLGFTKALNSAGFPVSPDLRVEYNPGMRYNTAVWRLPEHVQAKWPVPGGYELGVVLNMTPDSQTGEFRIFVILNMECDQTLILTGGWNNAESPHSVEGLRIYVKSLYGQENLPDWIWTLLDFLEEHEEECSPFHAEAKAKDLPPNFVAIGDAIMKLNPIYGQGTTKACIDVTTLDATLRRIPSTLPLPNASKPFFNREAARVQGL